MEGFKNLMDLQKYFSNELICMQFIEQQRWGGKPVCPHCLSEHFWRTKSRFKSPDLKDYKDFWCKACNKKYTTLTGSIYNSSKVSLQQWICAVYLVTAHKKGISSVQLGKDLGVTQKTAWFMLHRIREMVKDKNPNALKNIVEVDEVYIGGKIKNKHKKARDAARAKNGSHTYNKTGVLGLLERGSTVKVEVIDVKKASLIDMVKKHVCPSSTVITDSLYAYFHLHKSFAAHEVIKHDANEYVRGHVYTNTIEGFFSQLKRSIFGIYHQVSPKHLQRYCDENAYRYNTRAIRDNERFAAAMTKCGESKLGYRLLIQK